MQSKEKEKVDISRVLRIIFVRSFTYLSLLVIIVFVIFFIKRKPSPDPISRDSKDMVIIVDGYPEFKEHIQGLREGLLFKGIHTISYSEEKLGDIKDEKPLYVLGTQMARLALEKLPGHIIIGYTRFRSKPSDNYTGIFSGFDWAESLKVYRSILPEVKTLGVLYTEGFPKSWEQVKDLEKYIENDPSWKVRAISLSQDGRDLKEKLDSLLDSVDAFLGIVQDRNIESALSIISTKCLNRKIPFIGGGKMGAQMGALAAFEYDQKRLGRQAADTIVYQIVKEKKIPSEIPILFPEADIFINLSTSYKLDIQFPQDIVIKATEKYH